MYSKNHFPDRTYQKISQKRMNLQFSGNKRQSKNIWLKKSYLKCQPMSDNLVSFSLSRI